MASLTGKLVAETYKALLKTIDNDILTASEKQITDGFGGGSNVFIDSQGFLRANKYKVTNGLATQFLKADGSLDSNTYLTGITSSQIIAALGYTPVTSARTLTINGTTYDLSANRSWTVAGTAAVWGNISGTLSDQTDLQTALNAKYNNPAGTISQYIRGDGSLATFPTISGGLPTGGTAGQILAKIDATDYNTHWIDNYATQTKNEVKLGQTLAKGAAVYVSSANGTNMIVSAASNTSEATSSKTFGLLETGGATNALVKCVTFGLIAGLDTSAAQAGDPVWLGVNGALIFGLANKPVAPAHMVYIGVVTRVQSNNGEIFVNVQNGFEIEELHDVLIQSKANNQGLFYESSTGLWKNKSIATVLGYTPQAELNGTGFVKASGTTISYDNSTYLTTTDADTTYQRLSNLSSNLNPSTTRYPSINAVIAGLDLKLDLTGGTLTGSITATSFVKTGGTSVQYLKADGSVAEITGDIISGAGSSGYVPKWTSAIVLGSSILYDNGTSMGIGSTNVNYHAYGRSLTGSGFASNSFGFEASSAATTNGSLIGGLSMIISGNDSTRRIGSAIQSYISGSTATNLGADLRFYAKPDNGVLAEIVRITSSLITFNKDLTAANITATSFVKSGGTASEFLMADGSVSTLSSPVTGSGSAGYIPKWTTAANIGSSNIFDDGTSIGIAYSTPNKGGYGRTLTGAAFGSASFGFEAVGGTTTNGGLIGGLSFILSQNDSSRIVGSAIQSNLVGTTATNYGADLRFFAKADAGVIAEVARMTSAGLRVYGTIVKDGGTSSQVLMADGSVSAFPSLSGYLQLSGGTMTGIINNTTTYIGYRAQVDGTSAIWRGIIGSYNASSDVGTFIGNYAGKSGIFGHTNSMGAWNTLRINSLGVNGMGKVILSNNTVVNADNSDTEYGIIHAGNVANYSVPNRIVSNWNDATVLGNVVGLLAWKNWGNGHVIFDASAGTSPSGTSVSQTNATIAWQATNPTLMGWNGQYSFGVRVDSARIADNAGNITAYTINQNLGTGNSPSFSGLTINTGGTGTWAPFVVNSTSQWGDGATQYVTIGAGGAAGIMINNPHIVWNAAENSAAAKYGRSGGVSSGSYYVAGTGASNNYFVAKDGNTPIFNINSSGNSSFTGTLSASNLSGTNTGDQTNISGSARNLNGSNYIDRCGSTGNANTDFQNTPAGSVRHNGDDYGVTNGPGGWWFYDNYRHSNASNYWGIQVAWGWEDNANRLATRNVSGNNFGGWVYYLNSLNYGNYAVPLTGGTMSGALNFTQPVGLGFANGQYIKDNGGGGLVISSGAAINLNATLLTTNTILNYGTGGATPYAYATGLNCGIGFGGVEGNLRMYGIFTEKENIGGDYTKLTINWHTGIRFGAYFGYGGTRFYNNSVGGGGETMIMSVGNGDSNVRVTNNLYAAAFFESSDAKIKTIITDNYQAKGIESVVAKLYYKNGKEELGYYAQDVKEILPSAVSAGIDGLLNLSYREVHTAKIARLEKRVAELEKQLNIN